MDDSQRDDAPKEPLGRRIHLERRPRRLDREHRRGLVDRVVALLVLLAQRESRLFASCFISITRTES